jgi:hypothetical protein
VCSFSYNRIYVIKNPLNKKKKITPIPPLLRKKSIYTIPDFGMCRRKTKRKEKNLNASKV